MFGNWLSVSQMLHLRYPCYALGGVQNYKSCNSKTYSKVIFWHKINEEDNLLTLRRVDRLR